MFSIEEFPCSLSQSDLRRFYRRASQTWTITDRALKFLDYDLQAIVNCSTSEDIILFQTRRLIRPSTSIVIPWNLTWTSDPEGHLVRDEQIVQNPSKVNLSCPETGPLFTIR